MIWFGILHLCVEFIHCVPQNGKSAYLHLSALEKQVVAELNLARSSPKTYASFLEKARSNYIGKYIKRSETVMIVTEEGVSAVDEAIRYLRSVKPQPPLRSSPGMSSGARDHVMRQGPTGKVGHRGTDGSEPSDRVNRYGEWQGSVGENIAYGREEARDIVMGLIIDDGVPDRGHRHNIFDPDYRVVGVACGDHKTFRSMCVITLAGGYIERE